MGNWIFQANPDRFDVDRYIEKQDEIKWLVARYGERMYPGDRVYLWRAQGRNKAYRNKIYGIIAEGTIAGPPEIQMDDAADLWRNGSPEAALRVPITIIRRCRADEQVIRADWLQRIPDTSRMAILTYRVGTNFPITNEQADCISDLITDSLGSQEPSSESHQQSYRDFGDAPNDNPMDLQNYARQVRRGQPQFRDNLLRAYGRKCSITGEGPEEVLEAVHIVPHAQSGINELDNGLLMRADLHLLFDDGLLSINPVTRNIALDSRLQDTPYWQFNGAQLRLRTDGTQVASKYLRERMR